MLYENVCIESFAHLLPETVVTSNDLEERVAPIYEKLNLNFGRFEMMTGIRERRVWDDKITPSQAGASVANRAITEAGIDKRDIGCLLHTSVCRDFIEMSTASLIHSYLELPEKAIVFDISNACLGFANGMIVLANMIELGQIKAGIVVGEEGGKRLIDSTIERLLKEPDITKDKLKVSFASLTLGSGAVACVLTHSTLSKSGHKLLGGVVRNASQHNVLCHVDADTCYYDSNIYPNMVTDYTGILVNGLKLSVETWAAFQQQLGWTESDVDCFFTHQISTVHQKMLFSTLELDIDKGFSIVEYLGNMASCSLPISLAIALEEGRINVGDKIAMMAAGSGLGTIALGLEW